MTGPRLIVPCEHCGKETTVPLGATLGLVPKYLAPMTKRTPTGVCACGHEGSRHPNGGPCEICAGSIVGATCPRFHSRALRDPKPRGDDLMGLVR